MTPIGPGSREPGPPLMPSPALAPAPVPVGAARRHVGRAFAALAALLAIAIALSVLTGALPLPLDRWWVALVSPSDDQASAIVWDMRVPRTLVGIAVGVAYGVAGALMQSLTRNPLADPGILGVNAGAGFAVTLGVGLLGLSGIASYQWFAFAGAVGATLLVFAIGTASRGPVNPVQLVLGGVAVAAVLGGVSQFLSLLDPDTFEAVRNWGLGSIARTSLSDLVTVLPAFVVALVLALAVAPSLDVMALGDDVAAGLGAHARRTRVGAIAAITLLAGGATALTGGIAFVGLMVPHVVRWIVGPNQRLILGGTMLAAPALVLVADVLGRVIAPPGEIEVGILAAVIGAPALIVLVRRRKASTL